MYSTKYQNIEYCFYDDYMTVAGAPIRYSEMVNITHKDGKVPAFAFTYGDRRFTLPYEAKDRNMIAPFFLKANRMKPEYADQTEYVEEPAYVEEPQYVEQPAQPEYADQTEYVEEPAYVEEPQYVEQPAQPEYADQTEYVEEPAYVEEPQYVEQPAQPEYADQTEYVEEPAYVEEPTQPGYTEPVQPEVQSEVAAEEAPAKTGFAGKIKSLPASVGAMPGKNKLIIAIIAAAVILAIVLFMVLGGTGKSVEGLDSRIKTKEVTTASGEKQKVSVIEDDANVEDYAASYCKSIASEKNSINWIFNNAKNETVMFSNQDGVILICSFEKVEGEEDDPNLFGSGTLKDTWIYYTDSDELVKI